MRMTATSYTNESPAGKILAHLQRHGEAAVKELEDVLEVSTTAVREHLTHLQAKDLVATRLVRRGPGRPHLVYFLTPKAQSQFPKQYDTLVNMLLREIAGQEGPERLQVILDAVGARLAEEYGAQIFGGELPERLEALRGALEERRMVEQLLGETIALEGTIREGRRSCHFTIVQESEALNPDP